MTLRRAVLYAGGASLLVAWFSSAASLSLQRGNHRAAPASVSESPVDDLAQDVQAQARRLKARLAAAPLPQQPIRNPFVFQTRRPQPPAEPVRSTPDILPVVQPAAAAEPLLLLIGLAEQKKPQGLVRTAMLETEASELIIAALGDVILQRYKITAIGADAIELADQTTGTTRRLALH